MKDDALYCGDGQRYSPPHDARDSRCVLCGEDETAHGPNPERASPPAPAAEPPAAVPRLDLSPDVPDGMRYRVTEDRRSPAEVVWAVTAVNDTGEGEMYFAEFFGWASKARAEEYAAWKTAAAAEPAVPAAEPTGGTGAGRDTGESYVRDTIARIRGQLRRGVTVSDIYAERLCNMADAALGWHAAAIRERDALARRAGEAVGTLFEE